MKKRTIKKSKKSKTAKRTSKSSYKSSRKTSYKRYSKIHKRGGDDYDKVNCCMCGKEVDINDTLVPMSCLRKYGKTKAHRICNQCWWDPVSGFAREDIRHGCPGCAKNLPLTNVKLNTPTKKSEVIIIDDDD
jgi:hypothetical protein